MTLHFFNDSGLSKAKNIFDELDSKFLKTGTIDVAQLQDFLTNQKYTEDQGSTVSPYTSDDRLGFISHVLSELPQQTPSYSNSHAWSWLALYHLQTLYSRDPSNGLGDFPRYILQSGRLFRRHLIVAPCILRKTSNNSPIWNAGFAHEGSNWMEQLMSRVTTLRTKSVRELSEQLYSKSGEWKFPRKGAGVPADGSFFIHVIQGLSLTYDLSSMTPDEILTLMPIEFEKRLKGEYDQK